MCELFAMLSSLPATVDLSLEILARHGDRDGRHKDGWGVGYYASRDVQLIREAAPAGDSSLMRLIEHHLRSPLVISHIRRATIGGRALANTQPFCRELGGRAHLFAHNGTLKNIDTTALPLGRHRPIGDTDSEYVFCALLARLERLWLSGGDLPSARERFAIVTDFAAALRAMGPANFLYADGDMLFAHGHRRVHDDGAIRPPGLCRLARHCPAENPVFQSAGVTVRAADQHVLLFASVPLTSEGWMPLAEGEVVAVRGAEILFASR